MYKDKRLEEKRLIGDRISLECGVWSVECGVRLWAVMVSLWNGLWVGGEAMTGREWKVGKLKTIG